MLSPGIVIAYDGTHASIPSNWSRATALDGKYPKAWGAESPGTTGGSATHSHTSPSHQHSLNNHTHTGTTGARTGGAFNTHTSGGSGVSDADHTHNYTLSSTISGGDTSSDSVTYAAVSNDPPYYEVVFIEADSYTKIPTDGLMFNQSTSRAGMSYHTASQNRYLKGAAASSDAGGTGGSTTNEHDISHSHTETSHTHSSSQTDGTASVATDGGSGSVWESTHTHTMTVGSGTQSINAFSGTLTTTETVEPEHRTLNVFKASSETLPEPGDIAMWTGSAASIPVGWKLCDGTDGTLDMRDKFFKATDGAGTSTTGGSNTHSHAAQAHSHTSSGNHAHIVSFDSTSGITGNTSESGVSTGRDSHSHGDSTASSESPSYASATTTADSANNEPEYTTVVYIELDFLPFNATVIPSFM